MCMATQLGACSSASCSSSTSLTPCSFKNETAQFTKFVIFPRKKLSFSWVSKIGSRFPARDHFQLKSSNGHPLNAVSSHDG